jgi:hypothetical protein
LFFNLNAGWGYLRTQSYHTSSTTHISMTSDLTLTPNESNESKSTQRRIVGYIDYPELDSNIV